MISIFWLRILYYSFSTAGLAVLLSLIQTYPNWYSFAVAIGTNSYMFLVLANFVIAWHFILTEISIKIFFGRLRTLEANHVFERSWASLVGLIMILLSFQADNSLIMLLLVVNSFNLKCFGWMLVDRIEYKIQRSDTVKQLLASKEFVALNGCLGLAGLMTSVCDRSSLDSDNGEVYLLFAMEYTSTFLNLLKSYASLVLNSVEMTRIRLGIDQEEWESKTFYMKVTKLILSVLKFVLLLAVVWGIMSFYHVPISLVRDLYVSAVSLLHQVRELRAHLRTFSELNVKLSDATVQDLVEHDVCIVCHEEMDESKIGTGDRNTPKKLNCSHIIHLSCLKKWIDISQTCPMCRAPVFSDNSRSQNVNTDVAGPLPDNNPPPAIAVAQGTRDDPTPTIPSNSNNMADIYRSSPILNQIPRDAFRTERREIPGRSILENDDNSWFQFPLQSNSDSSFKVILNSQDYLRFGTDLGTTQGRPSPHIVSSEDQGISSSSERNTDVNTETYQIIQNQAQTIANLQQRIHLLEQRLNSQ
ncbi:hypothetical protein LJB42_000772 [Komagataella kurtzmanii]|nr:hypothetical protein LJB42_000772 [Komagataella kurtzmanii]